MIDIQFNNVEKYQLLSSTEIIIVHYYASISFRPMQPPLISPSQFGQDRKLAELEEFKKKVEFEIAQRKADLLKASQNIQQKGIWGALMGRRWMCAHPQYRVKLIVLVLFSAITVFGEICSWFGTYFWLSHYICFNKTYTLSYAKHGTGMFEFFFQMR